MSITSPQTRAAAHDRLEALLDAAVDAMILIDDRGHISRFNLAAERVFGYRADETIGRNVSMLMPEPYRSGHDGYLSRYQATGDPRIIGIGREVVARRKDGSEFPIDLSVGEFRSGDEHGFVGILRDISDRKRQQAELRRSSEELRLIFDNAPTAITLGELDGRVLDANRACCLLLGYERDELLELRDSDLIHPDDRPGVAAQFLKVQGESEGESFSLELRYLRRDGSVLHALLYAALVRDVQGRPLMTVSHVVDRSAILDAAREADELRDRLAHVARLGTLGEMVSGIAHEVNQPLTAIANYANACKRMLASGQPPGPEIAATLEKISHQSERAGQVIRGLRNLLRKQEAVHESLECNQLVREVVRLTEFELRQGGFDLVLQLAPDLPPVRGDGIQIQQVLLNLIRNGLDAMNEYARGDSLQVTTAVLSGWVELAVADCGRGIDDDIAARLYEPFFTTKAAGIGLGLSICQSIITAHRGEMRHERNAAGGTTFRIRLPTSEAN